MSVVLDGEREKSGSEQPAPLYSLAYTEQAVKISEFIKRYWLRKKFSPTIREIMTGCRHSTESVTWRWLKLMRARGHLFYEDGQARTFRLPGMQITFKD